MFQPIENSDSSVVKCANALRSAIITGRLLPDEKLPPERELAVQFGVNRVTIRAALSRLHAAGLVSVRQGSGYRVRDPYRYGGTELLPSVLRLCQSAQELETSVSDLLSVRRSIAASLLSHLSRGLRSDAIRSISRAIDRFSTAIDEEAEASRLAQADEDIYRALLVSAGSSVLQLCVNPILDALSTIPQFAEAQYARPSEHLVSWRLFEAWLAEPHSFPLEQILAQLEKRDQHTIVRLRGLI